MTTPKTRAEAKRIGATHYFTGKPCTKGHIALRKTKGACVECLKLEWVETNEKRKMLPKSEASKEAGRKYYQRNKELVKAKAAARPADKQAAYKLKYKMENPEVYRVLGNARRRRHREATPAWLTKDQRDHIKQLYLKAQELTKLSGVRYEVDHIIPLINESVCGLHVPWNLQVIPKSENLKKSNKITCRPHS